MLFLKKLILKLYLIGLIPKKLLSKKLNSRLISGKIFYYKRSIKKSKNYYHVHPMPSKDELNEYYQNNYWEGFTKEGKNEGVDNRDKEHFSILKDQIPSLFSEPNKILNFGAGHGGISHLFWKEKFSVVNVEPSKMNINYEERWEQYNDIAEIDLDNKFDLIYGSHSLEHVNNIESFYSRVEKLLKPNSYIFWEVPNGNNPQNGGCNGIICAPHTYYFTKNFFNEINNFDVIFNKLYDKDKKETDDELNAVIIRYLGRKIF